LVFFASCARQSGTRGTRPSDYQLTPRPNLPIYAAAAEIISRNGGSCRAIISSRRACPCFRRHFVCLQKVLAVFENILFVFEKVLKVFKAALWVWEMIFKGLELAVPEANPCRFELLYAIFVSWEAISRCLEVVPRFLDVISQCLEVIS
jgi:hypothetical protein